MLPYHRLLRVYSWKLDETASYLVWCFYLLFLVVAFSELILHVLVAEDWKLRQYVQVSQYSAQ